MQPIFEGALIPWKIEFSTYFPVGLFTFMNFMNSPMELGPIHWKMNSKWNGGEKRGNTEAKEEENLHIELWSEWKWNGIYIFLCMCSEYTKVHNRQYVDSQLG